MKGLFTFFALATMAAFAAEPWKAKSPADWTAQDAERILTDSPWAKRTSADMGSGGMGGGMGRIGTGPSGGIGGMGGSAGGMGGPGGGMGGSGAGRAGGPGDMGGMSGPRGGMGGPGGGFEPPRLLVRWESAEPVREALTRTESAAAAKLADWAKEFYVISTSGMPMMRPGGRRRGDSERPQPDPGRMEEMRQRMLQTTSLVRKGKDPVVPARLEMLETAEGRMTVFLFPRAAAITAEDKEVSFETSMGPMRIRSKFKLKDMQYQGKLSL